MTVLKNAKNFHRQKEPESKGSYKSIEVLLVEDDSDNAFLIKEMLTDEGVAAFTVNTATSLKEAFSKLNKGKYNIILLDLGLPDSKGISTLAKMHEAFPKIPIVVVTGLTDKIQEAEMIRMGAQDYLEKNRLTVNGVKQAIYHALERHMLMLDLERERDVLAEFVAASRGGVGSSRKNKINKKEAKEKTDEISKLIEDKKELLLKIREQNLKLEELAHHDLLTKLPNRFQFEESLRWNLAYANRRDKQFALLFLDLDDFKDINDNFGHDMGDLLLKEVGNRLRLVLRREDFVARLGGDEFAVILTDLEDVKSASIVANKIIEEVNKPYKIKDKEVVIGISIGISWYPASGGDADAESMFKDADIAMYQAKQKGRNNYQFMTDVLSKRKVRELSLDSELRLALPHKELFLVYQPFWEVKSKKMVGMEALLRWKHPELGLILPSVFIPMAEKTGLIMLMGEWVLRAACEQYAKWSANGYDYPIAINLSAKQLDLENLPKTIIKILNETGVPAKKIELELTETAIMQHENNAKKIINALCDAGVTVSIDDFGTGYSSLSRLSELPINILKIDRSFIKKIGKDKGDEIIIKSTIALAKSLKIHVLAEGVETEQQRKFLMKNGCNYAQGYYYSKPLTAENMTKFLAK
jgi:diguanylate cyclase (GGDEF)-like protein